MYIPIINKIIDTTEIFVERALPVTGRIITQKGSDVNPYDHIGECSYSYKVMKYPKSLKPRKYVQNGQYYYYGAELGKIGVRKVEVPFNGRLYKKPDGAYELFEEEKRFILLAGVWGVVENIVEGKSVLIKTRVRDVSLIASTSISFAGELVVFPNPSKILEKHFIENFSSRAAENEIVYVGNFTEIPTLEYAEKQGWGGVICGSADRATFEYAKMKGITFGIISGFGVSETPDDIFKLLNSVSNRYVLFEGQSNILRIPIPKEELGETPPTKVPKQPLRFLKKGLRVMVLQNPYFGFIGTVDSLSGSSILVRFNENENPVEVKLPNILAFE